MKHPLFFLALALLLLLGCRQNNEDVTLTNELTGTSWQWERAEIENLAGEVLRTFEQPDSCLAITDFSFQEDRRFIFNPGCLMPDLPLTCGNWEIQNGELSVLYTNRFQAPDFCELANGVLLFYELEMPFELRENVLIVRHIFHQNERPNANDLAGIASGDLFITSYYSPAPALEFEIEDNCCLDEPFPN